jgi:hypothetical protein
MIWVGVPYCEVDIVVLSQTIVFKAPLLKINDKKLLFYHSKHLINVLRHDLGRGDLV